MKKAIAFALAAVMALSMAACGDSTSSSTSSSSNASDTEQAAEASTESGEASASGLSADDRADLFVTVATGPTSGVYFPIGGAFATALGDYGYQTTAQATAASAENIQLILDGDAEIAICMQDSAMQAYGANGAYDGQEPAENLTAMMRLWPNYVQCITVEGTGITSISDLKGKRVGVGPANSGLEINTRTVFEAYGLSYDDCEIDYLSYSEAIDNMKNGQCDAVFVTSGLPNATVTELSTSYDMVIVPIDGEGRDKMIEEYPYYSANVIPAGTYNNTEDVETVSVYNILVCNKDLDENEVYDMLTGIFENVDTIKASHNAADKNIDITYGVDDIVLPLHPGAEAFWKDQGYIQ